ncbi:hypothetical protein [Pontibacterium sp.]|uniref:hypothetical protein n=1 Tax=Pontibacterium sp. TaxID=2036026 RepID=UPI0035693903
MAHSEGEYQAGVYYVEQTSGSYGSGHTLSEAWEAMLSNYPGSSSISPPVLFGPDYFQGKFYPSQSHKDSNHQFSGFVQRYYCANTDTSALCQPPPVDCPSAGETKRLGYTKTEIPSNMNGGEGNGFTINISNSSSVGASIESNGCGYNRVESSKPDCKLFAYDQQGNQRWNCYAEYVATGEPAASPPDSGITYSDGSEDGAPNESEGVTDTRQSNTTTTSTTPVTEMVGDQTVTTKTDITTENRGDGSVVETRDDVTIITESDGITRTDTQTTTTTTAPDGSQTIETTNNISYTQHPQTIYNIDNSNNQITVSQTPGGSASQTSTTTETYDANGNLTDREESTGPVQGDDDAAEGEERQTCDTNPLMDKCINDFTNTAKGQFGDISTKISTAKTEFQDEWNRIKSEASDRLGFSLSGGGGALQQSIVTVRGIEGDIGITRWVPYFDEFGLAALVMAGAALYAAVVMFRG